MHTLEAIETRRSIKHFDPEHRMTPEEQKRLLELTLLSPTAFNLQHWRLVVVEEPALRAAIQDAAGGQAQVTEASLLVVFCADLNSWQRQPERFWRNAPEPVRDYILPKLDAYYRDKPQVQRDEVMRSCGIAAQTLMLAARALGYDSCPMDGFDFDRVGTLIGLPADHVIALMMTVGRKARDTWPRAGQLDYDAVVIRNRFD